MMIRAAELGTSWILWRDFTKEEPVAVIQTGVDETMEKDGGSIGIKGGTEFVDIS